MAIRFRESDVRSMGRAATGVKGITLSPDDQVVGVVVAEPEACLLTVCAKGYGKRTPFGPNSQDDGHQRDEEPDEATDLVEDQDAEKESPDEDEIGDEGEDERDELGSQHSYRTQRRGGKGIRDIKTGGRNGPVVGIVAVHDDDEVLMMTAKGKIQRIRADEIRKTGRNAKGVRLMTLDEGDTIVAVKRIPAEPTNGSDEERDSASTTRSNESEQ